MATNRIESLDPALIRPGRIDRKIEFPLPDVKTKRRIFGIHTGRMTLSEDVNLEEFVMAKVSKKWTSGPAAAQDQQRFRLCQSFISALVSANDEARTDQDWSFFSN